uniref:Squalene monooxygenase family protein n=1 Tax=Rhizophora mucronata TaxID=61149 RepID=A0A2P2JEY8_RHIMU
MMTSASQVDLHSPTVVGMLFRDSLLASNAARLFLSFLLETNKKTKARRPSAEAMIQESTIWSAILECKSQNTKKMIGNDKTEGHAPFSPSLSLSYSRVCLFLFVFCSVSCRWFLPLLALLERWLASLAKSYIK